MTNQDINQRRYSFGWHEPGEICLAFWQGNEKRIRRVPFDWFFYLERKHAEKARNILECKADNLHLTPDKKFVKVFIDYYQRDELVDILENMNFFPLEADVYPFDRFMAEYDINFDSNSKILWYDLETDPVTGWDDITKHRILSVAYRGFGMDKTGWLCTKSADDIGERILIEQFLDLISKHDILVAWNGDSYDELVLRARAKLRNLYPKWKQVAFLDMMELFKKYYRRDAEGEGVRVSFALENIALRILGKSKIQDVPKHKLLEVWKRNRPKLCEYNVRDVDLIVELEDKMQYVSTHRVLSNLCNRFLSSKSLGQGYLTDGFVLKYGAKNGIHFPTKPKIPPKREKIKGAYVSEPLKGLHEGVIDLDFSSLYPNIVMAYNISPETRIKNNSLATNFPICRAENGAVFRNDFEGVFPAVSRLSVDARLNYKKLADKLEQEGKEGTEEHKKALQTSDVYKILSNALYGTLSSPYSRYYDPKCGGAITETGAVAIKYVYELAKENGLVVVAGDTDSGFFKCDQKLAKEFIDLVAINLDQRVKGRGAKTGKFRLKIDAEFLRIFFTAKKKYAGKKTTGKTDIRGLEAIRSDGCRYAREMQKRFIEFILEEKNPTSIMAQKILKNWAKKVFGNELSVSDLSISVGLQKKIDEYKTDKDVHVRIAKHLLSTGREIYVGMKIPYIVIGKDCRERIKAVHVDDYENNYDSNWYWRSSIYPPTKRILDVVFPNDKHIWKDFTTYNPKSGQESLTFDKPNNNNEPVLFRFEEQDQDKLQSIADIVDKYQGNKPLNLNLCIDDSMLHMRTNKKIRLCKEIVKQVEKLIGRRVYFGPEQFDEV